jgi:hypothetical protein
MPPNLTIAAFVFGAALILIGLTGGGFEVFGIKILGKVGAPMRIISSLLGVVFVILGLAGPSLLPLFTQLQNDTAQPPPGPGGPITVTVNANPLTVTVDQWTEINVMATNSQGQPIPDAMVNVRSGGGVFENTGNLLAAGNTGPGGVFVTRWKCKPCAGAYVMDVTVTKPNYGDGKGGITVHIQ